MPLLFWECKKSGSFRNRNRVVQRFFCVRCGKSFSGSNRSTDCIDYASHPDRKTLFEGLAFAQLAV